MNYSKYIYISSYFQDYTVVSDFNKYLTMKALKFHVEVLPENIPCSTKGEIMLLREAFQLLRGPFQIPFPTEEVLFFMQPNSKGYITVFTSVPCIEGNLNEVIISKRLILRILRTPSLLDILQYHDLYKQSEPMNLYVTGGGGSRDLCHTLNILNSNPTTLDRIIYTVFLKNLDGSEGELIGEVSSFINRGYGESSSVSYVLKKEH